MYSRLAICAVAVALSVIHAFSFSQPTGLDQYRSTFEQISLPIFARVNAIHRDDQGFLWFGTGRGLCKFDGYQVRVFPIGSPQDARAQIVMSITRMDQGSLLLGTGRGLWIFNLDSAKAFPFPAGTEIGESRINTTVATTRGTIWIGTSGHGLFHLDLTTKSVRAYSTDNGLTSNHVLSLVLDRSGWLWIGTSGGGLNALETTTLQFRHYRSSPNNPGTLYNDNITALCEHGADELWIGTTEGLNILHLGTGNMSRMDLQPLIKNSIESITQDPSGRMWIGVLDLGLLFYSKGEFTTFTTTGDIGRSLTAVRKLYPDPVASTGTDLLLWVGTRNGVNRIFMSLNPFNNHIRNRDSLYLDRGAVLSMCEDREGMLWAGMWGGGLDGFRQVHGMYERALNFKNTSSPASLPNNDVGHVMEDRRGILWIATRQGLATLDSQRKRITVYRHVRGDNTSLVDDDISKIFEDRAGAIWVCTGGGLSKVVPGNPIRFVNFLQDSTKPPLMPGNNFVSDIVQDRHSNLWVSTYGRGLNKLEADGTFKRSIHSDDTARTHENWIYNFVEDRDGVFWLSTGIGLVSFDRTSGQYTRHEIEQLHEAPIFAIYVDTKNNLWLSTAIGLAKYSPGTNTFVRFDDKHGFAFSELRSDFCKSANGRVFVGGLDGFVDFDPDNVSRASRPPAIVITAISVFEKDLPAAALARGEIQFPHDQNFISFSFAALDYTNPGQNRFMYMMVGVDNGWVDAGTRNYARYPNLNPGSYIFQVRGSNQDNAWNEAGTTFTIVITPPYWRTWWFRTSITVLIITGIYAIYRYRLHRIRTMERLRLRIAHDLHDDLGSNLSAIAIASMSVRNMPEITTKAKKKLTEIYEIALSTSEGMKDLVWFIKPETDTLDNLLLHMKETAPQLLGNIDIDFHLPKSIDATYIPVDFKRSIFLAFKEVTTNIAKHAKATNVDVHISLQNDIFEMIIKDNGRGFDTHAHHRGTGLHSLHKRALGIGGACEITSQPDEGTSVTFSGKVR